MWYNPIVTAILRSPFHGLMSGAYVLVTFKGRKSGATYSTPVQYRRDGDTLTFVTRRKRLWWRNLQGGAQVELLIGGRKQTGRAAVVSGETDPGAVAAALRAYLGGFPGSARLFGLPPGPPEAIPAADLEQAARPLVAVRVDLVG